MPLTADNIKFFAAQLMADTNDGGGRRSSTVVQSGTVNNVFPAVTASDRQSGRTSVRKVYLALMNIDTVQLTSGKASINEVPSDSNIEVAMWVFGDAATKRQAAVNALNAAHSGSSTTVFPVYGHSGGNTYGFRLTYYGAAYPAYPGQLPVVGEFVALFDSAGVPSGVLDWTKAQFRSVIAIGENTSTSGGEGRDVTVSPSLPVGFIPIRMVRNAAQAAPALAYGAVPVTASVLVGAVSLTVGRISSLVVPAPLVGAYPTADLGFPPAPLAYSGGRVPVIRAGDTARLYNETSLASQTVANAQIVNVGRANLDQLAVVGSNGVEIARFFASGPGVTGTGCSANLVAGTVTFTSVTGYSQPVTIKHRIAESVSITSVTGTTTVGISATALAYGAVGTWLSSEMPLGDVYARTLSVFSQQAWTNQFSDIPIGNPASLPFFGNVTVTNDGAETDRWALVFMTGNTFKVYSETLGQIGTGNTATTYAPLNPLSNKPYFTLASGSWATTVPVGTVMRFNTVGANPPVWVSRATRPSVAGGTDRAALRMVGSA